MRQLSPTIRSSPPSQPRRGTQAGGKQLAPAEEDPTGLSDATIERQFRQLLVERQRQRSRVEETANRLASESAARHDLEERYDSVKRDRQGLRVKYNGLKLAYTEDCQTYQRNLAAAKKDHTQKVYELGQHHSAELCSLQEKHDAALVAGDRRHADIVKDHQQKHQVALEELASNLSERHQAALAALNRDTNQKHQGALTDRDKAHAQRVKELHQQNHAARADLTKTLNAKHEADVADCHKMHRDLIKDLNLKHHGALSEHDKLQTDLLQDLAAKHEVALSEVQAKHDITLEQLTAQQANVSSLEGEKAKLEQNISRLQKALSQRNTQADELASTLELFKSDHIAATKVLEASNAAQVASLEAKIEEQRRLAQDEIDRLKGSLQKVQGQRDAQSHTNTALEIDLKELREKGQRTAVEISTLTSQLQDALETKTAVMTDLESLTVNHQTLTQDRKQLKKQHAALATEHESIVTAHSTLQLTHECIRATYDDLSEEHQNLSYDFTALENLSEEMIADLGAMVAHQEETAFAVAELRGALSNHDDVLADTHLQCERRIHLAQLDERTVKAAREHCSEVQKTVLALEAMANRLTKEVTANNAELRKAVAIQDDSERKARQDRTRTAVVDLNSQEQSPGELASSVPANQDNKQESWRPNTPFKPPLAPLSYHHRTTFTSAKRRSDAFSSGSSDLLPDPDARRRVKAKRY